MIPKNRAEAPVLDRCASAAAVLACSFFFVVGRAFVPHLGIQNDEALFAAGIYRPTGALYAAALGRQRVPLMLMSYLGALKSWIYTPLFHFWPPGPASTRVPMLLAGSASIWLFFALARRIAGSRAALIGCALLATDSTFLLTTCFDWGPVALQHLLLLGGMALLLRCYESRRSALQPHCRSGAATLAAAFFLFGLGMWDKALFSWTLVGLVAGALAAFPKELVSTVTVRRLAIASFSFCLGALPLIVYNVDSHLETFRANASYTLSDLRGKAGLFRLCVEGPVLFGWMIREDAEAEHPQAPRSAVQRASFWLSEYSARPRRNLMFHALLGACLLWGLFWRREGFGRATRTMLFSAVFLVAVWFQMAVTKGAGGSAHHAVLLWPFPQLFVAVAAAGASRPLGRFGPAAVIAVLLILLPANVLVTNQYYAQMVRNGGALNWTDAIYPLADFLKYVPAREVFVVDWGILDSLRLLDRGKLPLRVGSDPLSKPSLDEKDKEVVRSWLEASDDIFVAHTQGNEFFEGVNVKLQSIARDFGYRRELLKIISDRNGRPIFEVFRFARLPGILERRVHRNIRASNSNGSGSRNVILEKSG